MRFQVETSAPIEVAFAEIADFANLENWDPFARRSWLESGESLAGEAVYVLEAPGGLTLRYRIIDIERPKFIVYQGGTQRVRSTDTIEVKPTDTGSCVTLTSELRFRGWMRLASPLITALVWIGGRYVSLPRMQRHLSSLS